MLILHGLVMENSHRTAASEMEENEIGNEFTE